MSPDICTGVRRWPATFRRTMPDSSPVSKGRAPAKRFTSFAPRPISRLMDPTTHSGESKTSILAAPPTMADPSAA